MRSFLYQVFSMKFEDIHPVIEQVAASYARQDTPEFLLKLAEIWYRLGALLLQWLRNLHVPSPLATDSRPTSNLLIFVIYIIGIFCAAFVIYALIYKVIKAKQLINCVPNATIFMEPVADASRWKAEAAKLAQQGDYRNACRALYLSMLRLFEECSISEYVPAKTNYEYLYLLKKYPHLQDDFRRMYEAVERIWFGGLDAQQEDYSYCLEIFAEVEAKSLLAKQNMEKKDNNRTATSAW